MKILEAPSVTKVTIYETEKRVKSMMAKKEETVKKEGRQLSFTLFYYLDISQKKVPLNMKKHMPKNKFFVSYISNFLLQYKIKTNKNKKQL